MTPAINLLKKSGADFRIHEYQHDTNTTSYGEEAAEKMGIEKARVFKTLIVQTDNGSLTVAIIPVSCKLNLKSMARATDSKKACMAKTSDAERSTGYVLGGISPLGQKKCLRTLLDASAEQYQTIFISGGRRGLDIELPPSVLLQLTSGKYAALTDRSD